MSAPSQRARWRSILIIALIVFLPTAGIVGTYAADRLGYCVNAVLPGGVALNANPYVQDVRQDAATIVWRSTVAQPGVVRYGPVDGDRRELRTEPAEIQVVRLDGLEPGTTYDYEVERGSRIASGSFTTAPAGAEPVRIAVLGDSGTGSREQYGIAERLVMADPDLVLHTGDVVYRRGALCHYGPRYFEPYRELISRVPVYPTLGNHDLLAADGRAYRETFVVPAVDDLPDPRLAGEFYAFAFGPVTIVALNSEYYATEDEEAIAAQRRWLDGVLARADTPWTIVFLHRPPYASTPGKAHEGVRDDLTSIFAERQVDLVLAGHAHNYERIDVGDGVTYLVTGGGGAPLYDVPGAPETVASARAHHFVQIDADAAEMRISVIGLDGAELDAFRIDRSM